MRNIIDLSPDKAKANFSGKKFSPFFRCRRKLEAGKISLKISVLSEKNTRQLCTAAKEVVQTKKVLIKKF